MKKRHRHDKDNNEDFNAGDAPRGEEPESAGQEGGAPAGDAAPAGGEDYVQGEPIGEGDIPEEVEDYRSVLAQKQALEEEREALREERDELKDQYLRTRAEFDNYRKRLSREAEDNKKRANEALVHDLLPILDHLELALEHGGEGGEGLTEGVRMVHQQLRDVLSRHGLEIIESRGAPFDPNVHEALMQNPSEEVPEGHVLQTFQTGYSLAGRVIRPAKVVVSQGAPGEDQGGTGTPESHVQSPEEKLDGAPGQGAKISGDTGQEEK